MLEECSIYTTPGKKGGFYWAAPNLRRRNWEEHYTNLGFDINSYRAMRVFFVQVRKGLPPYTTHLYLFQSKPSHLHYSMILAIILTCKFNFMFVQITHTLTKTHLIYVTKYKIKSENDAKYTKCLHVEYWFQIILSTKNCIYLVVGFSEVACSQFRTVMQIRNKFGSNRTQPILSFQSNMSIPDASSLLGSNNVLRFLFSDTPTLLLPLE
jgi:hypothetical protein